MLSVNASIDRNPLLLSSSTRVAAITWKVREIGHIDEFFQHLTSLADDACKKGANVLVFPELFEVELLSLHGDGREEDVTPLLLPYCESIDKHLHSLATSLNVVIIGGSHLRPHNTGAINVSSIIWSSGDTFLQPKNCRTQWEKDPWHLHYETGLRRFPDKRLGVLVCYDSEFPEAARALAEDGTELLCVPSYCESQHGHQRVLWSCLARAIENELFVVHTSLVGPIERFSLGTGYGRSSIITPSKAPFPDSSILAQTDLNEEGIAIADINFDDLATCRGTGDARPCSDRKVSSWELLR